jgi:hypothetical protein
MRLVSSSILAVALLAASAASAATPGFAFLEIPTGARAVGLGGAYASVAKGPEAMYWNAAGVATASRLEIAGGHSELFTNLRHDYFSLAAPAWGGGMAASIRALYSEPIDERDDLGNLIGTFGAHDLELSLGYGHPVGAGVTVGGTASMIRERISNLAAMTFGFGAGATWEPEVLPGARLAIAGRNLGHSAHYTFDGEDGSPIELPASGQAGISYSSGLGSRMHVTGAVEGEAVRGRSMLGMFGAELGDLSGVALRMGVRVNDTASTMSFGAGYALQSFSFDYAFVPLNLDLGDSHRFSFNARF